MREDTQRKISVMLCLLLFSAIPFLPVVRAEFTNWDDPVNVTGNRYLGKGFTDGLLPLVRKSYEGLYVPLTYIVYWAGVHLWGVSAIGFHLLNLTLHLMNVALVYLILRRLLAGLLPAVLATLWWGVHPLTVEPVAWVTGLKDLLSALLILCSLYLYVVWRGKSTEETTKWHRRQIWGGALFAFILSCFSKPGVVAFPLVLLGYDVFVVRCKWRKLWQVIPYFIVSAVFVIVTMSVQDPEKAGVLPVEFPKRILVVGDSTLFYLQKMMWPVGLSAMYGRTTNLVLSSQECWGRLFAAIAVCLAALLPGRHWRWGVVIFVAGFMPVSGLVTFGYQRYSTVADRYVYFSLVGAALIVGDVLAIIGLNLKKQLSKWGIVAGGGAICWVCILGALTWRQTQTWQNSVAVWQQVIETRTRSSYARASQVAEKDRDGTAKGGLPPIELNAVLAEAYYNRGVAWGARGNYDRAIEDYNFALEQKPDYAEAYSSRGNAWIWKGEYDKAIEDCMRAIALKPEYADAYNNRGAARGRKGEYDLALEDCMHAIKLNPEYAEAYYNRGTIYGFLGERDLELQDYDRAIEFKLDYAMAYNNRGAAWGRKGDYKRAIEDCTQAIKLKKDYAAAFGNRAMAYYSTKRYDEAWADVKRCLELGGSPKPEFVEAVEKTAGRIR